MTSCLGLLWGGHEVACAVGGLVVSSTYDRLRERNSVSWTWTLKTGRAFPSGPEFVKAWNPGFSDGLDVECEKEKHQR